VTVTPPEDTTIDVRSLTVRFAGRAAVDGVALRVPAGGVLGLLGRNGAGKSTTMRVLAGALAPTTGMSVPAQADRARALVGFSASPVGLAPMLTVRESIGLALASAGLLDRWPQAFDLAERLEVADLLDRRTGTFSHGMARRVSVLLAVLASRQVLLLDEPFDGVDARGTATVCELVEQAAAAGLAVVVSTHLVDLAARVVDQAAVMSDGKVVAAWPGRQIAGRRGAARYARLLAGVGAAA
jgi:ABC-2 type transport system ATP-binding protein